MRTFSTLVLFCISLCGFSQVMFDDFERDSIVYFYTLNSDTVIGEYSSKNAFTGYIKQYKKSFYKRKALYPFIPLDSLQYDYVVETDLIIEGEFQAGKKIGKWTRYGGICPICYSMDEYGPINYLYYKEDTVTFYSGLFFPIGKTITYINDSNEVYGRTYIRNGYLLKFKCLNKDKCYYWLENPMQMIDSCNYSEFGFKLSQFEFGLYEREIRERFRK
jgi:hypothetical protein